MLMLKATLPFLYTDADSNNNKGHTYYGHNLAAVSPLTSIGNLIRRHRAVTVMWAHAAQIMPEAEPTSGLSQCWLIVIQARGELKRKSIPDKGENFFCIFLHT
jgi:hypothetical protein